MKPHEEDLMRLFGGMDAIDVEGAIADLDDDEFLQHVLSADMESQHDMAPRLAEMARHALHVRSDADSSVHENIGRQFADMIAVMVEARAKEIVTEVARIAASLPFDTRSDES